MSEYYTFVDLQNNDVYDLGKRSEAKYYLPFLAYRFKNKPVLIFGDEACESLCDVYQTKECGGEYNECSVDDLGYKMGILDDIIMSNAEFDEIMGKIEGKEVPNLDEYIRYKYNPENL